MTQDQFFITCHMNINLDHICAGVNAGVWAAGASGAAGAAGGVCATATEAPRTRADVGEVEGVMNPACNLESAPGQVLPRSHDDLAARQAAEISS